jgi:RNA polymerase sigma factor (TIGR02999 family)
MGAITDLLEAANHGDARAQSRLLETVYDELRKLAAAQMRRERAGHTLQPTALVNEAYLRLIDGEVAWQNRRHFFGAAAEAMRRVLVDHARRRDADKRGGGLDQVTLEGLDIVDERSDVDLIELDNALAALNIRDPRLAKLVELRFFTGLSIEQTADVLGISPATAKRNWAYARAWLYEHMGGAPQEES